MNFLRIHELAHVTFRLNRTISVSPASDRRVSGRRRARDGRPAAEQLLPGTGLGGHPGTSRRPDLTCRLPPGNVRAAAGRCVGGARSAGDL